MTRFSDEAHMHLSLTADRELIEESFVRLETIVPKGGTFLNKALDRVR